MGEVGWGKAIGLHAHTLWEGPGRSESHWGSQRKIVTPQRNRGEDKSKVMQLVDSLVSRVCLGAGARA